jgi:hypothetical protein
MSNDTPQRLTAARAKELALANSAPRIVDELLEQVRQAAEKGLTKTENRSYFGGGEFYRNEKDYPEWGKQVLAELRRLGFACTIRCREGQFVDMWLEISWEAAA